MLNSILAHILSSGIVENVIVSVVGLALTFLVGVLAKYVNAQIAKIQDERLRADAQKLVLWAEQTLGDLVSNEKYGAVVTELQKKYPNVPVNQIGHVIESEVFKLPKTFAPVPPVVAQTVTAGTNIVEGGQATSGHSDPVNGVRG